MWRARRICLAIGLICLSTPQLVAPPSAAAWWPWTKYEGSPRIDPISPIGNRLPPSYRRAYNRPTYVGGKIAAQIEPSSQEAMAFNRADAAGLYDNNGVKGFVHGKHCPPRRVERHYFYPKPWEALLVGPRRDRTPDAPESITDDFENDSQEGAAINIGELVPPGQSELRFNEPEDEPETRPLPVPSRE